MLKRWAYEEPGRDRWQQPERVLEALSLRPGLVVADVGSGGGYFALRLAQAVGPDGRVYACDVDAGLNRYVAASRYLRAGARLAIVDYREKHSSISEAELVEMLETAGFELEEQFDFLEKQYFLVFRLGTARGNAEGALRE